MAIERIFSRFYTISFLCRIKYEAKFRLKSIPFLGSVDCNLYANLCTLGPRLILMPEEQLQAPTLRSSTWHYKLSAVRLSQECIETYVLYVLKAPRVWVKLGMAREGSKARTPAFNRESSVGGFWTL
jgi:hypothetical protein